MRESGEASKPTSEKPPLTVSGATMRDAFEAFALAHEMRQRGIPVCALHVDSSEDATQGNNSAPAQSENVHHEADKSAPAESESLYAPSSAPEKSESLYLDSLDFLDSLGCGRAEHARTSDNKTEEQRRKEEEDAVRARFTHELLGGHTSTLPFEDFLYRAIHEHHNTPPRECENGERDSALFYFQRVLRLHPLFTFRTPPAEVIETIEGVMCEWRGSGPGTRPRNVETDWLYWFGVECEDARTEILSHWPPRIAAGRDRHAEAFERSRQYQVKNVAKVTKRGAYAQVYERFLGVAGWLQVVVGAGPILLPGRRLGELLGVKQQTVSNYVQWAIADNFLRLVQPAAPREKLAAAYVFNVGRCPMFAEAAAPGTEALYDRARLV